MRGEGCENDGGKAKKKDKAKKGSKSGNPAKRAAEEAAKLTGEKPNQGGSGSAFGV